MTEKEEKKRKKLKKEKKKKQQKKNESDPKKNGGEQDEDEPKQQECGESTKEEVTIKLIQYKNSSDTENDDGKSKKKKKDKKSKKKKKKKDKKRHHNRSEESSDISTTAGPTEKRPRRTYSPAESTSSQQQNHNSNNDNDKDHGDPRIVESSALESKPSHHSTTKAGGSVTLLLFYQYVEPIWSLEKYQKMIKDMGSLGHKLGLTGRMRVAREGLNCTLTGSREKIVEFCLTLRQQSEFETTEFKLTNDLPEPQRFPHLKLIEVIELVHYGLEGEKAPPIQDYKGVHLEPQEYHKKIAEDNTVMIDVRNHYEAIIGHFQPPKKANGEGPQWLDPNMRKSTEFPIWLDKPETKEKLKGKQVLMYVL